MIHTTRELEEIQKNFIEMEVKELCHVKNGKLKRVESIF